jgi:hypothetical protein
MSPRAIDLFFLQANLNPFGDFDSRVKSIGFANAFAHSDERITDRPDVIDSAPCQAGWHHERER